MFFDQCAQQVVHPATTALERLAVEDFDPHGALLAVDLAVRRSMFVLDELDPLPGIQRGMMSFVPALRRAGTRG